MQPKTYRGMMSGPHRPTQLFYICSLNKTQNNKSFKSSLLVETSAWLIKQLWHWGGQWTWHKCLHNIIIIIMITIILKDWWHIRWQTDTETSSDPWCKHTFLHNMWTRNTKNTPKLFPGLEAHHRPRSTRAHLYISRCCRDIFGSNVIHYYDRYIRNFNKM